MKKLIPLLIISFLLTPLLALADGMILPPYGYSIKEAQQTAVILYEDKTKTETLVLSIQFEGDAEEFAWVIPTPSEPEVDKASRSLITSLEDLTRTSSYGYETLGLGSSMKAYDTGESVTIVEKKKVDYYDITTLSAEDSSALSNWLNDHGYTYPKKYEYVLNSYIENDWYFVAVKIDTTALDSKAGSQLKEGEATPLKLTFQTDNIVYPLKISSVISEEDATDTEEGTTSPQFTDGKVSLAVNIREDDLLSASATDAFSTEEGTVELWVKPKESWESGYNGYWELINVVDRNDQDVFEFRRSQKYDTENENVQIVFYKPVAGYTIWQTEFSQDMFEVDSWYHLAATWQENAEPQLYINGQAQSLSVAYDKTGWEMRSASKGTIYFGQRKMHEAHNYLGGLMDEVRISNKARTAEEIAAAYNDGLGKELAVDQNTTLLAHLDDLDYLDADGEEQKLDFDQVETPTAYVPPAFLDEPEEQDEEVSILLYLLTDNKQKISGFSTNYADKIKKAEIKELAQDDNGNPWIEPEQRKYFLTKLSKTMEQSEMTEDLFPKDADDNKKVGVESSEWFEIFAAVVGFILIFLAYFALAIMVGVFSPLGLIFIGGVLLNVRGKSKTAHVFGWIMEIFTLSIYVVIALVLIIGSIIYNSTYDYSYSVLSSFLSGYSLWMVLVGLIPIYLLIAAMVCMIVWQVRRKKKKLNNNKTTN